MRKIILALLLVLAVLAVSAQTVVYVNSAVVAWDAVTTLANGDPAPSGQISYEILIAPLDKKSPTILGETAALIYTVTLPTEGDWLVGVRAVRKVGTERILSSVLWSDGTINPFVLRYYLGPAVPTGLGLQ